MLRLDSTSATGALLLTDAVNSTQLAEQLGYVAIAGIWEAHDRIARDLLSMWHGREVDKTDGMLMLFGRVADAVACALALHRALAERNLPIQLRAGIHVGSVIVRRNDAADVERGAKPVEITGVAVPITTRVMSIALAGQTLLTGAARSALGDVQQPLRSHGSWRLKGIADPVEIFEIADNDAAFRSPSDSAKAYRVVRKGERWRPLRELSHSLPAERDKFVGRREELQALSRKLESGSRLVSIAGIGGGGKTRLATRFAWEYLGDYPGGAWFCDLSSARDVDGIALTIAQGLQVPLGTTDPIAQLGQAIAGRGECLVVLDNFEQVAQHAEATLGRLIERAPQARFIATTRSVLGIAGEELLQLAPLPPDEAAELFSERASAAQFGYAPNAEDTSAVRQLVRVLDGLPLAIELAAARVRVMPPRTLVVRMRDRFELIGASRGRRDRQATLRAAFDWSWELLADHEKAALAMLSVFEGGFTLDSAAAVLQAANGVIDTVQGLVDKSFVRRANNDRFDLLETVREYVARHLNAGGSFAGSGRACAEATHIRHWHYFAAMDERAAIANHCVEVTNLIAACRAASAAGDAAAATACLVVAWAALRLIGPYRAAVALAELVLAVPNLGDRQRALAHWVAGDALEVLGNIDPARVHLQRGVQLAADAQAPDSMARLLITIGKRQTLDGQLESARSTLEQANTLAIEHRDVDLQMRALNALGLHSDHQSRWKDAQAFYERALALARSLGDRRMEGGLLGNLGGLYHDMGEPEKARTHYEMALQLASELGDHRWEGNARSNLGLLYQEQGKGVEARSQFETALAMARQVGHVRLEYTVLCNLGILLAGEGRTDDAASYFEQAVAAAVASSDVRAEGQFRGYLAVNQARRGLLDDARASLELGERLLRAMSDQLSYALLLCDRAHVEILASDNDAARQALEAARQIAAQLECRDDSELCRRIEVLASMLADR